MALQICYKPKATSETLNRTDMYCVYVDDATEYAKWKDGDTSIPLTSFVGRFDVFHSPTGATGKWDSASKASLENDLECTNKDDAIIKILKEGTDKTGGAIGKTKEHAEKNQSMSGGFSVSAGSKAGGHGGR